MVSCVKKNCSTRLIHFRDVKYLSFLKELYEKYGIGELIFTSDGGKELVQGTLPGVFAMVNFQNKVDDNLDRLQKHLPGTYATICCA